MQGIIFEVIIVVVIGKLYSCKKTKHCAWYCGNEKK